MRRKIKVLHIEDRFNPLMGYQINFFAKYHYKDFDFHILTSNSLSIWKSLTDVNNLQLFDKKFQEDNNVEIHRIEAKNPHTQKSFLWLKGLNRKIKSINPDIIFVHVIESYTAIRVILHNYFCKNNYIIFSDTHNLYNQFRKGFKSWLHFWFIRNIIKPIIIKRNMMVFATVAENINILVSKYNFPEKNIDLLPIGSDSSVYYHNAYAASELRQHLKIGKDELVLLYAGKINERKRPHLIIDALKQIDHKLFNTLINVIFVGSKIEPYFSTHFKEKTIQGFKHIKVIFHKPIKNTNLYKFYSMADFVVFPDENTLSALDAQLCKAPVIMALDTTNKERLAKGGLLFEKNNIKDLANKMLLLIKDSAMRKKLGEEGLNYVIKKYEYKNIVRKLEEYFYKAMDH